MGSHTTYLHWFTCARETSVYYILWLFQWFVFFSIEPDSPPVFVQGYNTSSTSILVEWGNVPHAAQNGIILRYTVHYKVFPNGTVHSKPVSAPSSQVTLRGLKKYTNYSIWVSASTVMGNGNASKPIIVTTDEDSKFPYGTTVYFTRQNSTESLIMKTFKAVRPFSEPYNINSSCNLEILLFWYLKWFWNWHVT